MGATIRVLGSEPGSGRTANECASLLRHLSNSAVGRAEEMVQGCGGLKMLGPRSGPIRRYGLFGGGVTLLE